MSKQTYTNNSNDDTNSNDGTNFNPLEELESSIDWNIYSISALWVYLFITFFCIFY